jgi:hypothetical protein
MTFLARAADGSISNGNNAAYINVVNGPPPPLSTTCIASPNPSLPGQSVTFIAFPSGGTQPYTFRWSGAVVAAGQGASFTPQIAGTYSATVTVTDSGSPNHQTVTGNCSTSVNNYSPATMTNPLAGSVLTGHANTPFSWSPGIGATQYKLLLGSAPGKADFYQVNAGTTQTAQVSLPSGSPPITVWATIGSQIAGIWWYRYYSYRVAESPATPG